MTHLMMTHLMMIIGELENYEDKKRMNLELQDFDISVRGFLLI